MNSLRVNPYGQGFANRTITNLSKTTKKIFDSASNKTIEVLPQKPHYGYATRYKVLDFPVIIDGQYTVFPVTYKYPQNHINRVGGELMRANSMEEVMDISAREISNAIKNK